MAAVTIYLPDLQAVSWSGTGSVRTCTRTRIPVNSHPSRFKAVRSSALRCRTMAATAPASRGKFQLPVALVGNANAQREGPRQVPAHDLAPALPRGRGARPRRPASRRSEGCAAAVAGNAAMAGTAAGPRSWRGPPRWGKVGRSPIEHHSGLERHGAGAQPHAGLAALDAGRPRRSSSSSSPSPASSTSSRCAMRRRSSTRGCRRSCSPTSGRKR